MATIENDEQAMDQLSLLLIQKSHGLSPDVALDNDTSTNLRRLSEVAEEKFGNASHVAFIKNTTFDIGGFAGALVYGPNDELLVRVTNAVFGVKPSTSMLTERLLVLLGVNPEVFALWDVELAKYPTYGIVIRVPETTERKTYRPAARDLSLGSLHD